MNPSSPSSVCETISTLLSRSESPESSEDSFASADGPIYLLEPTRSTEFWFEEGNTVVRAGNTIYNLHASILKRQSSFFREVLHAPGTSSGLITAEVCAVSTQRPLYLCVSKRDFELFLTMIYPSDLKLHDDFSIEEWAGITHVAETLEFLSIRKMALESILSQAGRNNAPELICLGRMHGLEECILRGCRMLCAAEEPLSLEVGKRIGMEMVIQVAHARELLAKGSKWSELELKRFLWN